ncbi:uncharacterized protein [Leptinotarsa decemlineata]|uniref:uncharacterized protein n=1 Tax=Leptinotarsa decemlineata TaxID=7539 RepID=UPI003D308F62
MYSLVCGCDENEVPKMHCFPRNAEKCKLWQDSLGIQYPGNMRHLRICSTHFNKADYIEKSWKLKSNALPIKFMGEEQNVKINEEKRINILDYKITLPLSPVNKNIVITEPIPGPSKEICGIPFKKEKLPVKTIK